MARFLFIFLVGLFKSSDSRENSTKELDKQQQQIMTLPNLRVKTIHGKLFWIFLARDNTVHPLFSNIGSIRSQKKVQIK